MSTNKKEWIILDNANKGNNSAYDICNKVVLIIICNPVSIIYNSIFRGTPDNSISLRQMPSEFDRFNFVCEHDSNYTNIHLLYTQYSLLRKLPQVRSSLHEVSTHIDIFFLSKNIFFRSYNN